MKSKALIAVSVAAVGIAALCAWQYQQKQTTKAELETLRFAFDESKRESQQELGLVKNSYAGLEKELATLRDQLAKAEGSAKEGVVSGASAGAVQIKTVAAQQPKSAIADMQSVMQQRMNTPEGRKAMAKMMINSGMGEFIKSLKLSPEREAALIDRLASRQETMMEMRQKVTAGEMTEAEWQAYLQSHNDKEIWDDYVNSQQKDALRQYLADQPIRNQANMEAGMYVQVATQTPGLTNQNRSALAAAMAKSTISIGMRPGNQGKSVPMDEVYADAATKLQGTMDAAQLKIVTDYFKRQSEFNSAINH